MARGAGQYVYTGKSRLRRKFKFLKLFGPPDNGRRRSSKKDNNNNPSNSVSYSKLADQDADVWESLQILDPKALDTGRAFHTHVNNYKESEPHVNDILSHTCKFCQNPGDLIDEDYFSDGSSDSEELAPLFEVIYLRPQYGQKMPIFGKKKKEETKPIVEEAVAIAESGKTKADEEGAPPAEETPVEEAPAEEAPAEENAGETAPTGEEKPVENGTSENIELNENESGSPKKKVEDQQPGGLLCCSIM